MQTLKQFGATIKTKYPEYKDIDDEELGKKMLTKYPQYKDMVGDISKKSTAEKIAEFAGVKNISKAIAYAISPEVRKYEKEAIGAKPTAKQLAGDVLQVGATLATGGVGGGATKGALGLAKVASKVGAAGAVVGLGSGLSENKTIGESLKQSFISGLSSAATYGVLSGTGKVVSKVLQKTPEVLMTDALKVNKKLIQSGKNPASLLIKEKQFGGLNTFEKLGNIYHDIDNAKLNLGEAIRNEVKNVKIKVNTKELLNEAVKNIKSSQGKLYTNEDINKAINSAPLKTLLNNKEISFNTLNELREQLGQKIGEFGFKKETPSLTQNITREVWKSVRNKVGSTSKNADMYISKLGEYHKAGEVVSSSMAQLEKQGVLSWGDIIAGGVGATAGGIPGAIGTYTLKKLAQSPNLKITSAQAINTFNEAIKKLPTDSLGRINKALLINLLK
jgi:hypothetical protein